MLISFDAPPGTLPARLPRRPPSFPLPWRCSSSFCSVSISDDTPKWLISRGPSRANGSLGCARQEKQHNTPAIVSTAHVYMCIVYMCVRAQSDGARAVCAISIPCSVCQQYAKENNQLRDYRSRLNYSRNFPVGYCAPQIYRARNNFLRWILHEIFII